MVYLLPEGLIPSAIQKRNQLSGNQKSSILIGSQGVHWDDIAPGKNFGAFTTLLPASASVNLGCEWAIIGHSEERRAKRQVIEAFEPSINQNSALSANANKAINQLINQEVLSAYNQGLNVLLCIGETAEERGDGSFSDQQSRIKAALETQILINLRNINKVPDQDIVFGYEPIWAIGPGKTPPGKEYISFVSEFIKSYTLANFGFTPTIVYGGGLKEQNAGMLASISTLSGGLIALTKFTGEIGFDVAGLSKIINEYLTQGDFNENR